MLRITHFFRLPCELEPTLLWIRPIILHGASLPRILTRPLLSRPTDPQQGLFRVALLSLLNTCTNEHINILGDTGPEHPVETPENQHNPKTTGPKSGPAPLDPDLQTVIDRWSELPPPIRRQIVKLASPGSLTLDGVTKKIPAKLDNALDQT